MARSRKSLHKWLAIGAQALCVVGIAYAAATSARFFWIGPLDDEPAPVAAAASAPERSSISFEQVRAQNLFGRPRANPPPMPTENLQETKLSLTLVGVFAGQGGASMALIARKGRPAERYVVGDRLPGNAKLAAVFSDRVVITRDGVRELIRFDHEALHFRKGTARNVTARAQNAGAGGPVGRAFTASAPGRAPAKAPRRQGAGARPGLLSEHWEAIERDPAKLLRELGVGTAAGDGAGKGYTLGALVDRPELDHTGLQRGDLLLSVNGHPVGDPEEDRLRLRDLAAHDSLRLEIQRGKRRMFITVAL